MLDQDLEYAELVYVGKKPFKADNVANTGTVWFGHGDCKKVPKKTYPIFARHPDVWQLKENFKTDASGEVVSGVGGGTQGLVDVNLSELQSGSTAGPQDTDSQVSDETDLSGENQNNVAGSESDNQQQDVGGQSDVNDQDQSSDDSSDKDDNANASRESQITNAILSLDKSNPAHFSVQTGSPIIAAVRTAAGDEGITLKEANAAWKKLNETAE